MSFLTPLAGLLLATAIPIILMYVLKLRREDRLVPSTLLWRRAVEDVQANAPWQRLRPSLLLLVQLLIVLVLVLTLARPAYTQVRSYSGDLVVIIDESFGMQAHDIAPSRFAAAIAQARSYVQKLGPGNVMSVISMSNQPKLIVAETDNKAAIRDALDHLRPTFASPNFLAALSLASSLARNGEATRVSVLTSRDSGISALPVSVPYSVSIVRLGGNLHDLGITAFRAIRDVTRIKAVLRVHNFGLQAGSTDVNLLVNGQLSDVRPIQIAAGADVNLFWTDLPSSTKRLQVQIVRHDDFDADKSAWAVVPQVNVRRALLVSPGNLFLQTVLALNPSLQLRLVRPNLYMSNLDRNFDFIIFDGVLPRTLPGTSTLLVAPPRGRINQLRFLAEAPVGTISTPPQPSPSMASLLQYVDFSDVHVARARVSTLPGWMQPLAVSGSTPLVAVGDSGTTRVGLIAFSLEKSDWPLRVSFPVAMRNLLRYLSPDLTLGADNVNVGQSLALFPDPRTKQLVVVRPDGTTEQVASPFRAFSSTANPGVYSLSATTGSARQEATFAVNFFHPRTSPASGPRTLTLGHVQTGSTRKVTDHVSFAWAFGVAALGLLLAEWWIAFRR